MKVYGYARCSTNEDRQDIARQVQELIARGATEIFSEYISGTKARKPELDKLLAAIGYGDILAVTEVSRLSRNVHQLCHLEELAREKGIKLQCGVLTLDYATSKVDPMNRAMYYMMGVFSELERGVTVDRIKSGIENAKENGVSVGRPPKTAENVPKNVKRLLPKYQAGHFDKTVFAKKAGISRQTLYKYLRLLDAEGETPEVVPVKVRKLYPAYKAGELNKSEYARRMKVARNTIKRYIATMEAAETED